MLNLRITGIYRTEREEFVFGECNEHCNAKYLGSCKIVDEDTMEESYVHVVESLKSLPEKHEIVIYRDENAHIYFDVNSAHNSNGDMCDSVIDYLDISDGMLTDECEFRYLGSYGNLHFGIMFDHVYVWDHFEREENVPNEQNETVRVTMRRNNVWTLDRLMEN